MRVTPAGWARVVLRAPLLAVMLGVGLALHLTLRLVERPVFGLRRPITPHVTCAVCTLSLAVLGLRLDTVGQPMRRRGAVVANHASWLDIFVLNAPQQIYFVSKSEVATWPFIGWLARATGTVFINRDARDARLQRDIFEARLRAGHHLCFFPEGTSSDGLRLLPFKPTLFAAFFTHGLQDLMAIQPVSVIYLAPPGRDARFFGWFGEMGFGAHLLRVLAQAPQGRVRLVFHPPLPVADFPDRKALSRATEDAVRAGLRAHLPADAWRD